MVYNISHVVKCDFCIMKKYLLEIVVFVSGAVVMIFEIVGSRVFGPYFGTSTFVWTSLIGIILGSLSLGYYIGGKLADRNPELKKLSLIIFCASILIGISIFIKDPLLGLLQKNTENIQASLIFGALVLFSPTSILLGMVSPYAAKLKINDLSTSGSAVGNLYALSTFGSIVGTFLAGFYLIPHFGTNNLLMILVVTLILLSAVVFYDKEKVFFFFLACILMWAVDGGHFVSGKENFVDVDTQYSRIWIYDQEHEKNGRRKMVRKMGINNENHSSMLIGSNQLVNEYTKYYHLVRHFVPDFQKSLIFGGAGYSFPKDYLLKYPHATIDVVEIDPGVTELAKKYFDLKDNPRMQIFHQDGRTFLNMTNEKYDAIFGDAFGSRYSVPYQMTTVEAVQKEYDVLRDGGVAIINLISTTEYENNDFLRAEYATYKKVFPQVYLFPVQNHEGGALQNIMLVALKSQDAPRFSSDDEKLNEFLQHEWGEEIVQDVPILTDDYAPVDYYMSKAL